MIVDGIIYPSIQDLCKAYNISQHVFSKRIKKLGLTVQEALNKQKLSFHPIEANGIVYPSEIDMCRQFNTPWSTFNNRRLRGYTLNEAVGLEKRPKKKTSQILLLDSKR